MAKKAVRALTLPADSKWNIRVSEDDQYLEFSYNGKVVAGLDTKGNWHKGKEGKGPELSISVEAR